MLVPALQNIQTRNESVEQKETFPFKSPGKSTKRNDVSGLLKEEQKEEQPQYCREQNKLPSSLASCILSVRCPFVRAR